MSSQFASHNCASLGGNDETRRFSRTPPEDFEDPQRTFVQFILEPLYKLIGHTLGEEKDSLKKLLEQVDVRLPGRDFDLCTRDLLKKVGRAFFQGSFALVAFFETRFLRRDL